MPRYFHKTVVGDLEADGLLHEATTIWCAVFKDTRTGEVFEFEPDDIHKLPGFLDSCESVVMHNGIAYDWPVLEKVLGYRYPGNRVDTLVMSRLQRPNRTTPPGVKAGPHSVEAWGRRFGRYKPEHEDWSQFSREMLHRCREDCEIQHLILNALLDEGRGEGWGRAHRMSFRLFDILHQQEEYGWLVDRDYLESCISELSRWITRIDRAVTPRLPFVVEKPNKVQGKHAYYKAPFTKTGDYKQFILQWHDDAGLNPADRIVGGPFSRVAFNRVDLNSNAQTKEFLLELGWQPEQWNTNDKGERTSPKLSHGESFNGIQGSLGRLIAKRVQCRHRRSQLEGWRDNIRPDGRIGQGIGGVASTGRLTHRRIVNVPGGDAFYGKQMRKCFSCKTGYRVVGVDSDACQNRMLAARVNDEFFTRTLIEGKKEDETSIHFVNQKAIVKYAGFKPSYKVCKNLNYAFLFGASDKKLATTAGVAPEYGPKIREALLSVAPGLERVIASLTEEWRSTAKVRRGKYGREYYNGRIKGLDGRPVYIESEHTILVYMMQSDEALLMQYALIFLYDWLTERGWKHGREYGFIANVHDEIQAEVREDLAEEYARLAEQAITYAGEYLEIACPHLGQADIGYNWYETH